MNFEQPPVPSQENLVNNEEEKRIEITVEELEKYNKGSVDKDELQKWMDEKGIKFDQGMIKTKIDGVNHLFNTDRNDFGTVSYPDDEISSQEKE